MEREFQTDDGISSGQLRFDASSRWRLWPVRLRISDWWVAVCGGEKQVRALREFRDFGSVGTDSDIEWEPRSSTIA